MSPGVMSSGLNRASELEDGLGVAGAGASGQDSFEADFGPFRFEPSLFFFFCTLAGFGPVAAVVVFSDFAFGFWACLLVAGAAAGNDPDLGFWDRVTAMFLFAVWYKMGCRTVRERPVTKGLSVIRASLCLERGKSSCLRKRKINQTCSDSLF